MKAGTGRARAPAIGAVLLAALALCLALPALSADAEAKASLADVEDEVMCPICGTLLELSDSPQADRERAFIRRLIDRGETKDQIKDALVDEYGRNVLATPSDSGFDLTAWLLPIVGLAAALAALIVGALRLSRRRRATPRAPPPSLEPDDAARLERDLSSYDL
ncbi:MAG: cytochrome c-type biogenesis protein CcmH [Myxococcales bacterium]